MLRKFLIRFSGTVLVLAVIAGLLYGWLWWADHGPVKAVAKPDYEISYYKGVNIVPQHYEDKDLEKSVREIKDIGANIIALNVDLRIKDQETFVIETGPPDFDLKRQIAILVAEAHRQGMQTELRIVGGWPESYEAGGKQLLGSNPGSADYDKFERNATQFQKEWAKVAERNDMYQFTIFAEVDGLKTNFTRGFFEDKIPGFSKKMLSEVRKHYQGKIGIGFLPPVQVLSYDITGFDYVEISLYLGKEFKNAEYQDEFNSFVDNVQPVLSKSRINTVILGETGVVSKTETVHEQDLGIVVTPEGEADYYQDLFSTLKDRLDGFYTAFEYGDLGYRGEPAEKIVKRWYKELK